ncbi:MAG: hypothetical protein ACTSSP_04020 [Candidatus Asgardarchaeia archaeon]
MRKKAKKSKKRCQAIHVRNRFLERQGINFGKHKNAQFVALIQNQKATLVRKQSLRVGVWDVEFEEKTYRVVYDNKRKQIVTTFCRK